MLLKDNLVSVKPNDAWSKGTNIITALKSNPAMIRGWVMSEVGRLCKELSAKTTIQSDEELIFCVNSIFEEHPTLKLEEVRTCFDMVRKGKFGKLYERLKTPEILDFLRRYEGEIRVEILERNMNDSRYQSERSSTEELATSPIGEIVKTLPESEPPKKVEGHGLGSRLRKRLDQLAPEEKATK